MNTTSLALDRFQHELIQGGAVPQAQAIAYRAALIPTLNSLFVVDLVSMPGTMTGQIISGVPPHIAARYQILVMGMMFGASGIALSNTLFWIGNYSASGVNHTPGMTAKFDRTIVSTPQAIKRDNAS